ncbi:hypothetical protein I79_004424 [Cricetulus griseus]|uniref:Uncharacterized protein n=1 Tax=Cricetulus griseus TaxID=10029 RepID=G3H2K9_CRIGR|nr:hypothetical protein I79_004424 [Cricetulus griseus]
MSGLARLANQSASVSVREPVWGKNPKTPGEQQRKTSLAFMCTCKHTHTQKKNVKNKKHSCRDIRKTRKWQVPKCEVWNPRNQHGSVPKGTSGKASCYTKPHCCVLVGSCPLPQAQC